MIVISLEMSDEPEKVHPTLRYCPFRSPIKPISGAEKHHIALQYRPFRMPKWCFSQGNEMPVKHKLLVFNTLQKSLIFRVFASEGGSARKYALIFRGRTGNLG